MGREDNEVVEGVVVVCQTSNWGWVRLVDSRLMGFEESNDGWIVAEGLLGLVVEN